MKTVKITAEDKISIIDIPFTLDGFYKAIGCDCVETVKTEIMFRFFHGPILMLVDESGLLRGKPVNHTASILYGMHEHGCPIVGDVIFGCPKYEDIIPPENPEEMKGLLMDTFWFLSEEE